MQSTTSGAHKWRLLRRSVLKRDGSRCLLCGASDRLTMHHIRPRALGGFDIEPNLMTVCGDCHQQLHYLAHRLANLFLWLFGRFLYWRACRR